MYIFAYIPFHGLVLSFGVAETGLLGKVKYICGAYVRSYIFISSIENIDMMIQMHSTLFRNVGSLRVYTKFCKS